MEMLESVPADGEACEIIGMAQQIWLQNCGSSRMPGQLRTHRLDKGKSQPELGKAAKATLKSYLGLRRASVAALSGTDGAAFDIAASFGNPPLLMCTEPFPSKSQGILYCENCIKSNNKKSGLSGAFQIVNPLV